MEAGIESGEKKYRQHRQNEILNKSLLPLGIISLMVWAVFIFISNAGGAAYQSGYLFWGLLATKITGLTASVFLVLHELKVHTPLADKICGFSAKTDCDTVLSSNASKLFGWINWADLGLVYFTGTFLYVAGTNESSSLWVLALVSALVLPYPVFSIYYQAVKTKKWCPFCLIVQGVLIAEFILLLPVLFQVNISVIQLLQLGVSFLIPAAFWLLFRAYRNSLQDHNKMRYSYLGFKRNPEIFRFLLRNNVRKEIPITHNSLVLGIPDAPVTVTAFLSLYCNPCANAFKGLKELLENCQELKINAVFSVYEDEESKKLINALYHVYKSKGSEQTVDFLYKWYTIPKQNRKTLYEKEKLPAGFDITEIVSEKNKKLFEENNVAGTPTIFVNGYKYPGQYEYSDIEFYIDELKKLNEERKRQEACANCH
ncbi:MAG: vitamin K epoxide reductase family protein [Bacteroidota bacterium]